MLDGRPPAISSSEKDLTRKERSTPAQLRSGAPTSVESKRMQTSTTAADQTYYLSLPDTTFSMTFKINVKLDTRR